MGGYTGFLEIFGGYLGVFSLLMSLVELCVFIIVWLLIEFSR